MSTASPRPGPGRGADPRNTRPPVRRPAPAARAAGAREEPSHPRPATTEPQPRPPAGEPGPSATGTPRPATAAEERPGPAPTGHGTATPSASGAPDRGTAAPRPRNASHAPTGAPGEVQGSGRVRPAAPFVPGPARTARHRAVRAALRAPAATRANALHAGAWWLWALGLATAASRTTQPVLLALLIAVAGYVVAARRTDAPWARAFGFFLVLGAVVVIVRVLFALLLGSPIGGTTLLFTLPEVPLPGWMQGVRLGGRVMAESLVFAFYDGLRLAALLVCLGAANALANPARLLKSLPAALYEAGVAVVVALTFAPHLIADVLRLRATRRLRGGTVRGLRALPRIALPVLEGALERSVALAAAMDARGYGRTARVPAAVRRTTTALTLGGLLGVCLGTYGLLAATGGVFGLPALLVGLAAALGGLWLGGRRTVRTRYRPDRWGARAWLVSGSGIAAGCALVWASAADPAALEASVVPLAAPGLPPWPAAAVLLGLLPALAAPAPPAAAPVPPDPKTPR